MGILTYMAPSDWQQQEQLHAARTRPWVEARLRRRQLGQNHPVEDFLFDYYPFRPSLLQRWTPGYGVVLQGLEAVKFLHHPHFISYAEGGICLAPLPDQRRNGLAWAVQVLRAIDGREAQWGCYGLHEWAMVYRSTELRHAQVPLRLSADALAAFVESQRICCSHYDAFRFFTKGARPLNRLQPEKGRQPEFEQPGCLHANMDLYKWANKFAPWVPAELIADTFELARAIREVDMRASPYDLQTQGYAPIPIETAAGRSEYEQYQRSFAEAARPLRAALLRCLEKL